MKVTLPAFGKATVLVVGDVMLDRYWYGPTSRISPEAPVPVVKVVIMPAQEAQALTHAYVTLRDALHHLALQALPGHVAPDRFARERGIVNASWQRWLGTVESDS
ncbi:hypothetical protein CRX72_04285 [Pantoea sp. BRM17]|nr:hypothetical protein CRX72_04285 [Pantoea sp. BRM17]